MADKRTKEKSMTTEPKATKTKFPKEWFMVRWNGVRITDSPVVPCRSSMMGELVTFDRTREAAEKRITEVLAVNDDGATFATKTGLIEVVKHTRGIEETNAGEVGKQSRLDLDKIEVIKELLPRVIPVVLRPEMPSFTGEIHQCFVAILDDTTPTGSHTVDVVAVPIESGIDEIYRKLEQHRHFPDSVRVRDDAVVVAEIIDRGLLKSVQEAGFASLIAESTTSHGYTSRFDAQAFEGLVSVDRDSDSIPVSPSGRFAAYREKIKSMQRNQAMEKLKAGGPEIG